MGRGLQEQLPSPMTGWQENWGPPWGIGSGICSVNVLGGPNIEEEVQRKFRAGSPTRPTGSAIGSRMSGGFHHGVAVSHHSFFRRQPDRILG